MEIAEGSGIDRALDDKDCGKLKTRPCPGEFIMLCPKGQGSGDDGFYERED